MVSVQDRSLLSQDKVLAPFIIPQECWTPADKLTYGFDDFFNMPEAEAESLRLEAIKHTFDYQYSNNAFYRNFCQAEGITSADIKVASDLKKIPKIPDTFFKDYPSTRPAEFYAWLRKTSAAPMERLEFNDKATLDEVLDQIESKSKWLAIHSSGTSGKFSIFVIDEMVFKRRGYIITKAGLLGIVPPSADAHMVFLGTTKTHLFFGKAMSFIPLVFDPAKTHCLTDRKVTMEMLGIILGTKTGLKQGVMRFAMKLAVERATQRMIKLLKELNELRKQVYIISSPYELYRLMSELKKSGTRLNLGDSGSVVITAAGWKIFEHQSVSAESFRMTVEDVLGIPGKHCRDIYGMSEWNGLALECEGHYKHIIQSTYPMVLGEDLEPLDYGEYGRFAFLDPLATTFPGFIMTGDRVKLLRRCPACNLTSPVLEPAISRMPGAESRGCGDLMRNMMAEDFSRSK